MSEQTFTLTPKAKALCRVMQENPCVLGSDEYDVWQTALMVAVLGEKVPPTEHDIPAYWEGYDRGVKFNKEWEEL